MLSDPASSGSGSGTGPEGTRTTVPSITIKSSERARSSGVIPDDEALVSVRVAVLVFGPFCSLVLGGFSERDIKLLGVEVFILDTTNHHLDPKSVEIVHLR